MEERSLLWPGLRLAALLTWLIVILNYSHAKFHKTRSIHLIYKDNIANESAPVTEPLTIEERRQVMERGCSLLPIIQKLVDIADFDKLFKLHQEIYDLDRELPKSSEECNAPSSIDPKDGLAKLAKPRHTINIFHEETSKLTVCLPPKAGTTNWQNALASLQNKSGRDLIPRLQKSDYKNASDISERTDLMVLNGRNPFSRLLSAWRDKFATNASPSRQKIFLPAMDIFDHPIPDGFVRSFESFIEYLGANPSVFAQNRHWQPIYYLCSPCHFKYSMTTQLENIDDDFEKVFDKLNMDAPDLRGQYGGSPLKSAPEEYYYSKISRETVKRVYMHYYLDFVLLGYTPQHVLDVLDKASDKDPPSEAKNAQSRAQRGLPDQENLNEICF